MLMLCLVPALLGAGYRTENFVVEAPTAEIAKQIGDAAEIYRRELAKEWLGEEMKPWSAPCPIKVRVGQIGAGGETRFSFYPRLNGPAVVGGWDMRIQGSLERILDSVLPHEISHTIFACHFRRPLPRWADEGAATLAEHESERRQQVLRLNQVIKAQRRIPLKNLLAIKEYPPDMQDVMTLYAEGYTLADLLVQEGGRAKYLKFLSDAHRDGWDKAIHAHYGYRGVADLEKRWHGWVIAGCPEIDLPKGQMLAAKEKPMDPKSTAKGELIVRGQSPNEDPFLGEQTAAMGVGTAPSSGNRPKTLTAPEPRPLPVAEKKKSVPAEVALAQNAASGNDRSRRDLPGERRARVDERLDNWIVPESSDRNERQDVGDDTDGSADDEGDGDAAEPLDRVPPRRPTQRPADVSPRRNSPADRTLAVRNSAPRRQTMECSEFPRDPRPSPLLLPASR
jgi:hypothetical protein